ncbi:hypothetical protein EYF80_016804 [Liparis tanakae]|uniref:Uncharacterized protein n=1 Tax=Liparis tanakae TaxID=230148 RepID=A0A4Z2I5X7_9TELE|nr:hypothetical protein EYF80_016804 [Liparis tanakae]
MELFWWKPQARSRLLRAFFMKKMPQPEITTRSVAIHEHQYRSVKMMSTPPWKTSRRKHSALYTRLRVDRCASSGALCMNSPDVMTQAAAAAEGTRGRTLRLSSGVKMLRLSSGVMMLRLSSGVKMLRLSSGVMMLRLSSGVETIRSLDESECRGSTWSMVYVVYLVYLVHVVYLVYVVYLWGMKRLSSP